MSTIPTSSAREPVDDTDDAEGSAEDLATRALLEAISGVEDEPFASKARSGHSPTARARVNATDAAVVLALSVEGVEPRQDRGGGDALRARLLASAATRAAAPKPDAPPPAIRALSEVLADQHAMDPADEERKRRIETLGAGGVLGGYPAAAAADAQIAALLERMAPFVPPGALFVSVVRGDQTIHRVHRGFPPEFGNVDIVPRFLSFCTHTVSSNGTLVVHDTSREAFFRRSTVATKFGARCYVGVALRVPATPGAEDTSDDQAVGALCSINFGAGRHVPASEVRFFEHCAKHAEAIVARRDTSAILRGDVYEEPFFRQLLAIEIERSRDGAGLGRLVIGDGRPEGGAPSAFLGRVGDRIGCLGVEAGVSAVVTDDVDAWIARANVG